MSGIKVSTLLFATCLLLPSTISASRQLLQGSVGADTCTASNLSGLDCVVDGPGSTRIHYSVPSGDSIMLAIEAPARGWVAIGFPSTPGVMVGAESVLGWVDDSNSQPSISTYMLNARSVAGVVQQDVSFQISDTQVDQTNDGTTIMQFRRTTTGPTPNCEFTVGGSCSMLVGYHVNADMLAFHSFRAGTTITFQNAMGAPAPDAMAPAPAPAMAPAPAPIMGPACDPSDLDGLDCVVDGPGSSRIHYGLPEDDSMLFAVEAPAAGWVALAFPSTPGVMVGAEAVLGWLDDADSTMSIDTYMLTARSLAGVVQQNVSFMISDTQVEQSGGSTIIQFRRSIDDSNPNCDFSIGGTCAMLVGYHSNADRLAFHTFRGGAMVTFLNAMGTMAPAPGMTMAPAPMETDEPTAMPPAMAPAPMMTPSPTAMQLSCTASGLPGLDCMVNGPGNSRIHYTVPSDSSVTFAVEAPAAGWVALAFPSTPGVMVGAEAVLGWLDDANAQPVIDTYMLNARSLAGVVQQDVSFQISDTQVQQTADGRTIIQFTRTTTAPQANCDFSVGGDCALLVGYHSSADQLARHTLRGGASLTFAGPVGTGAPTAMPATPATAAPPNAGFSITPAGASFLYMMLGALSLMAYLIGSV